MILYFLFQACYNINKMAQSEEATIIWSYTKQSCTVKTCVHRTFQSCALYLQVVFVLRGNFMLWRLKMGLTIVVENSDLTVCAHISAILLLFIILNQYRDNIHIFFWGFLVPLVTYSTLFLEKWKMLVFEILTKKHEKNCLLNIDTSQHKYMEDYNYTNS